MCKVEFLKFSRIGIQRQVYDEWKKLKANAWNLEMGKKKGKIILFLNTRDYNQNMRKKRSSKWSE